MHYRVVLRGWTRVALTAAVAAALLVSWPLSPSASAGVRTPSAAVGNTFGGLSEQRNPVVLDTNSTRRKVVRVVTVLDLSCTTSGPSTISDGFTDLRVNRFGKFRRSYGPFTQRNDDGTTTDFQGRIVGKFNDARTRITGVWRLVVTERDAAGVITDSCDSSLVSWKVKN